MERDNTFLIAKFGSKENLEQLKNGEIYFSSVQKYRDDGTEYRGDFMEGKIPRDPSKIDIYDENGKSLFEEIPRPDFVAESLDGDEHLMMFCAAVLDKKSMDLIKENEWMLKEEFKSAVRNFGDYVLLLQSSELLERIKDSSEFIEQGIGFDSRKIIYRDLSDFEDTDAYRTTGSILDRYFVKGLKYKKQNEWRVIIWGEEKEIEITYCGGFLLHTEAFKNTRLLKTADFFRYEY